MSPSPKNSTLQKIFTNEDATKIGMWLFISTELLIFLGVFLCYGIYRILNPVAFNLASQELSIGIGALDTIVLLLGSWVMIKSTKLLKANRKGMSVFSMAIVLFLGFIFIVNKYYEWKGQFTNGLFPGSADLFRLGQGDVLFYGFYFFITGLLILHLLVGITLISVLAVRVNNSSNAKPYISISTLATKYWHFTTVIWVLIYLLFYVTT